MENIFNLNLQPNQLNSKPSSSIQTLENEEEEILEYDEQLKNEIITFIESVYWLSKKAPLPQEIIERFELDGLTELKVYYEVIEEPLKNRGVKLQPLYPPVKTKRSEFEIDPVFGLAVTIICDTADKRSTSAKLKAIGLTTKQWQALLRKPEHDDYFQKRLNEAFGQTEQNAKLSLAKNVEAGDLPSIKYYHEFTGKYRPNNETALNLAFLLGRLMEILAKRIEPGLLAEIADEIDTVLEIKELESGTS